jgi:DNA-binding beta-propeller fold protein YncE
MERKDYQVVRLLLVILLFSACNKSETETSSPATSGKKKVFIVCEGSLGNGNSSLALYLPETDSVYQDVYKSANGQSLGDVFQSMTLMGKDYFLAINNSDKVLIIDSNFKLKSALSISKPRYILPINGNKAYVSSLFNDKIYIINPVGGIVSSSINMPAKNAEGMLLFNNKAYVCCWDTSINRVYILNYNNDSVEDSITVSGYAPQEIVVDKEQKLWVLSGNVQKGKQAFLTRIDPVTKQVIKSYPFPISADPMHPVFNKTKDTLYFIEVNYSGGTQDNGVYRMSIYDNSLPATAFIPAQPLQYFWGLGIDNDNGDIYVGDPKGFIQKGAVNIYSSTSVIKKQFNVGVGPGHFYFAN